MGTEIKFCGLTRAVDALQAATLGAGYVGVIFAGGPRALTPERAATVLAGVPASVRRVGVFGEQPPEEIAAIARIVGLSVAQLHGTHDPARVAALRRDFAGEIWPVVRVAAGASLPREFGAALSVGDGVLLDALVPGALGGTGVMLAWERLADEVNSTRDGKRIILAGGLRPENVGDAVAALGADVVDVSSGVESAPGIKDHDRMRAFRDAVAQTSIST